MLTAVTGAAGSSPARGTYSPWRQGQHRSGGVEPKGEAGNGEDTLTQEEEGPRRLGKDDQAAGETESTKPESSPARFDVGVVKGVSSTAARDIEV